MSEVRYERLKSDEVTAAREALSLVFVPIGSLEFHGLHLPVGLDTMMAYETCLRVARQTGGVVLPPTCWGTIGHDGYPGSVLLDRRTIVTLMRDVLGKLTAQGYRLIVICTGHHPDVQGKLLSDVAEEHMAARDGVRVMVVDTVHFHPDDPEPDHAGRLETSVGLHLWPELTDMTALRRDGAMDAITGDCLDATAEFGKSYVEGVVGEITRVVRAAAAGL